MSIGHSSQTHARSRGIRALVVAVSLAAILVAGGSGALCLPAHATTGDQYSAEELAFFSQLNDYRQSQGQAPFLLSDTLSTAAERHSLDMAHYRFFDHNTRGSDWFAVGSMPWDRMRACGYNYSTSMGENIAAGASYAGADEVFAGFKNSSGHNATMISGNYSVVGIAQVIVPGSEYYVYWTVDFGGYTDPSAHEIGPDGYYQETDSRLTYLGGWWEARNPNFSAGRVAITVFAGAAVRIDFHGTGIELFATTGPQYGQVKICLDGTWLTETIDFYRPDAEAYAESVFSQSLAAGDHSLILQCSGTKNGSATWGAITLDAVKITGTEDEPGRLVQAPASTVYQENNPYVKYAGPWAVGWSWSASGVSFDYANTPGEAVSVAFSGNYIAWMASLGPEYGKALVSLDGGDPVVVDLYRASAQFQQRVYSSGILDDGDHTLQIYWSDQKNAASYGHYISVDGFDVLGELTDASAPTPICWWYDDFDWRLTYVGDWSGRWESPAAGGIFHLTATKGAAAVVEFTGDRAELFARTGPDGGLAQVCIDGTWLADPVDFYSPEQAYLQSVFAKDLTYGSHTLIIKCLREKDEASSGYLVDIDALAIDGFVAQAHTPYRIEQTGGGVYYSGRWTWTRNRYASGSSYVSINRSGGVATVVFDGSYLAWIATTGRAFGKAWVGLDNEPGVLVDLYRPATLYRQQVYNTGLLTPGTHTLRIYWIGQKNPRASSKKIDVDAFDVLARW